MEEREHILTVCLDFSKAFDTLNHNILIRKLKHIGNRGVAADWIDSYLRNRVQKVHIADTISDIKPIVTGVPQGSVLGPLLFIIYINDMSNVCPDLKLIHYADDTTIYVSDNNINSLVLSF